MYKLHAANHSRTCPAVVVVVAIVRVSGNPSDPKADGDWQVSRFPVVPLLVWDLSFIIFTRWPLNHNSVWPRNVAMWLCAVRCKSKL